MSDNTKTEEQIRLNRHDSLDSDLSVSTMGTTGAGKSRFMSAFHELLGYNFRGIKISRGKKTWPSAKRASISRGINRSNATVYSVDQMPVFGYTPEGNVVIQFYAPGSHASAAKLESKVDVFAYFLDQSFLEYVSKVIKYKGKPNFFPYGDGTIGEPNDHLFLEKDEILLREVFTFKKDPLGLTIESLLEAQEKLENIESIPVIGLKTHGTENNNIDQAQYRLNKLVSLYLEYIGEHGFPGYYVEGEEIYEFLAKKFGTKVYESPIKDAVVHNDKIKEIKYGQIKRWYLVDSLSANKLGVKEAMYSIAVSALQQKGIDTSGFKLIRFIGRHVDDPLTVHYDNV